MPRDFLNDMGDMNQSQMTGRDFLNIPQQESFGRALSMAPSRLAEDILGAGVNFVRNIPQYAQQAQTEIPGVFNVLTQHPRRAAEQSVAGLAELGHNVLNAPRNIAEYASNRLNLLPQSIAEKVPYQQDISQNLNEMFGEPLFPGESLLRGAVRNVPNIVGAGKLASLANPLRYTSKGISKNVINELNRQVESHSKQYNKLWDKADKTGFNKVNYDPNIINTDFNMVKKYYTPKQYSNFQEFINNPTLQNAQKAQSDLGQLRRTLEEKAKKNPLIGDEPKLHEALARSEKHIEGGMFKDAAGNVNEKLANRYHKLTKSYAKNVVPYKYNPDIQAFLSKDITAKQLVERLSQGPFAAKKGYKHPAIPIRNAFLPAAKGLGYAGGIYYLLKNLLGSSAPESFIENLEKR